MTELDWVRIVAFGLLILYHVGMFYVPWDWHVKSPRPVPALEALMRLLNPWRLPLLFVVSGAATALLAERTGSVSIAAARSRRLLIPLLFGMAVIVPPQPYLEAIERFRYAGTYGEFLLRYFRADANICADGRCLIVPTWNHLWFVAYLWVYTLLLIGGLRLAGTAWADSTRWRVLSIGTRLLWMPWLLFAMLRQSLYPLFPHTNNLVWDWYGHAVYGAMFLLGFVLFGRRDDRHGAWQAAVRLRWWAVAAALVAHFWVQAAGGFGDGQVLSDATKSLLRAISAIRQWAPLVAILGFARLHLAHRDGPLRRTLTEAVFPFYIVHQTVIVIAAHYLAQQGWPQPVEAAAVVGLTCFACVASYVLIRRIAWMRPLFGLTGTVASPRPSR